MSTFDKEWGGRVGRWLSGNTVSGNRPEAGRIVNGSCSLEGCASTNACVAFAGFLGGGEWADNPEQCVANMAQAIAHRGPDVAGAWADSRRGIALGHRRLSVVDLSPPAINRCSAQGRFRDRLQWRGINHLELRSALGPPRPPAWRGHSDTETLLAACEYWGFEATLARTVGIMDHRLVRQARRQAVSCSGPFWREAALLRLGGRRVCFWF